jgi:hypothetical protein
VFPGLDREGLFALHPSYHHRYLIAQSTPSRRFCISSAAILFTSRTRIIALSYCETADISTAQPENMLVHDADKPVPTSEDIGLEGPTTRPTFLLALLVVTLRLSKVVVHMRGQRTIQLWSMRIHHVFESPLDSDIVSTATKPTTVSNNLHISLRERLITYRAGQPPCCRMVDERLGREAINSWLWNKLRW